MKRGQKRFAELKARLVSRDLAAQTEGSPHGPWRLSRSPAVHYAFKTAYFNALGLVSLEFGSKAQASRTAVYGPVRTVV